MKYLLIALALVLSANCNFYIDDFGAIPHTDTVQAQFANQKALLAAISAANASSQSPKVVVIPKRTYYFFPVHVEHVNNLHLLILGRVVASKNVAHWPFKNNDTYWEFLTFYFCDNLEVSGGGKIDGRGYHWWMLCFLDYKKYLPNESARPHLMQLFGCFNVSIHDLVLKNSPQFHLKLDECNTVSIYNLNIKVNTTAQVNLVKYFSLEGTIPMFPFNTDGIDPHGSKMHIYNLTIQNWDDVVVPKPGSQGDMFDNCTRDYLVENCTVVLGVGMSIGSISPSKRYNCIKNVTFRNVEMRKPWKGIYIKTNPGDDGAGIVSNIVYENFTMDGPRWWAIYIGPQQMKEPDGDGPGCMIYPLDPKGKCTTQPLVTVQNITLRNIAIHDSLLYPITIRCNVSNPCRFFVFENVTCDKWKYWQKETGVVCEYVTGIQKATKPRVPCFYDGLEERQTENMEISDGPTGKISPRVFWESIDQAVRMHPYHDEDDDDMGSLFEYVQA